MSTVQTKNIIFCIKKILQIRVFLTKKKLVTLYLASLDGMTILWKICEATSGPRDMMKQDPNGCNAYACVLSTLHEINQTVSENHILVNYCSV